MAYFPGDGNVAPKTRSDAKKLIGRRVKYLCKSNIDESGRGDTFPVQVLLMEL